MVTTILRQELSDGGAVYLEKMGRTYLVTRCYPELLTPPAGAHGLNLAQARAMYADFVRSDLFEADE